MVIRTHEVSHQNSENLAAVKTMSDNSVNGNINSGINEKTLPKTANDETVRIITEKYQNRISQTIRIMCARYKVVVAVFFQKVEMLLRELKCFVYGGRGHISQACPSPRSYTSKPKRQV